MKKKKLSPQQLKKTRKRKPLLCKNCKLYNAKEGVCSVVILDKGDKFELQTKPDDPCKWDEMGVEVNRIRAWSDGKDGHIEYDNIEEEELEE